MNMQEEHHKNELLSPGKRIIFRLVSISIPFLLLVIIEIVLRISGTGQNYKLFVEKEIDGVGYYVMNPDICSKYFGSTSYSQTQNRYFRKVKGEDTYRIFVLGSSTAVGFPYTNNLSFPAHLERLLQVSLPEKQIEVINTSITAVNSFTLLDFHRMIQNYEPDMVLFYAGHNEFYGAMGSASESAAGTWRWFKLINLRLNDLRIYQGLKDLTASKRNKSQSNETSVTRTLMERIASQEDIEYGGKVYQKTLAHFEKNLDRICNISRKKGVPLIVSNLVSNILDLEPFSSVESELYPPACQVYEDACRKITEGKINEARDAFSYARDLDGIRFRASSDINNMIRNTTAKYGIQLVEMLAEFESASEYGIVGNDLMTEHVHPNKLGYFLMAKAFYAPIMGIINEDPTRVMNNSELVKAYENIPFTAYDEAFARLIIQSLMSGWPFVKETGTNTFIRDHRPCGFVDSLALSSLRIRDGKLLERHVELAEYYLEQHDSLLLARQYHALAQLNQFPGPFYDQALKIYIDHQRQDLAFYLLKEAGSRFRDPRHLLLLADMFLQKEEYNQAETYLNIYLSDVKEDKQRYEGLIRLYSIYQLLGDTKRSSEILSDIREIRDDFTEVASNNITTVRISEEHSLQLKQARRLLQQQKPEEAFQILYKLYEESENVMVAAVIGQAKLAYGHKDAYIYLEHVFTDGNRNADLMHALIIANLRAEKNERAMEIYSMMSSIYPDHEKTIMIHEIIKGN